MSQAAQIVGDVLYREGDGQSMPIRKGPVDVETTATDATLSWTDGDTHGVAALPLSDYQRYLMEGAITLAR